MRERIARNSIGSGLPTLSDISAIISHIEKETSDSLLDNESDFQESGFDHTYSASLSRDHTDEGKQRQYNEHDTQPQHTRMDGWTSEEKLLLEKLVAVIPKEFIEYPFTEVEIVRGATKYVICLQDVLHKSVSLFYNTDFNSIPNEFQVTGFTSQQCLQNLEDNIKVEYCNSNNHFSDSENQDTFYQYPKRLYDSHGEDGYNNWQPAEDASITKTYTALKQRYASCILPPAITLPTFSEIFAKYATAYRMTSRQQPLPSQPCNITSYPPLASILPYNENSSDLHYSREPVSSSISCSMVTSSVCDRDEGRYSSNSCYVHDYPVLASILTSKSNTSNRSVKKQPRKRKPKKRLYCDSENTRYPVPDSEINIDQLYGDSDITRKLLNADSGMTQVLKRSERNTIESQERCESRAVSSNDNNVRGNLYENFHTTTQNNIRSLGSVETDSFFDENDADDEKENFENSNVQHEIVDSTTDDLDHSHDGCSFGEGDSTLNDGLKRPKNAFIRFSVEYRKQLSTTHPKMDNREVSRMLGARWRKMTPEEKKPYEDEFQHDIKEIRNKHPDWRYGPIKRIYHEFVEPMPSRLRPREKLKRKFQPFVKRTLVSSRRRKQKKGLVPMTSQNQQDENLNVPVSQLNENSNLYMNYHYCWMQCSFCLKLRRILVESCNQRQQSFWFCHMNPDQRYNSCSVEEECQQTEIPQALQQPVCNFNLNAGIGRFCTSGHFLYNVPSWSSIKHMY